MPPVVDASTPTRVNGATAGTALTTASFTPPNKSLLVIVMNQDTVSNENTVWTPSNNGTALVWTHRVTKNQVGTTTTTEVTMYTAPLDVSRAITVTMTSSRSDQRSLQVYVVTGYNESTPVGDTTSGTSLINVLSITGLAATAGGSLGIYAAIQDDGPPTATSTSPDGNFSAAFISSSIDGGSGYKNMGAVGVDTTYSVDGPGTTAIEWNWCGIEILDSPKPSPPPTNRYRRTLPLLVR